MENLLEHVSQLPKIIRVNRRPIVLQTHLDDVAPPVGNESEFIAWFRHQAIMPASGVTTKRFSSIESIVGIDRGDTGPGDLIGRPGCEIGSRLVRPAREILLPSIQSTCLNLSSNGNIDIVGLVRVEPLPAALFPAGSRNKPTAVYRAKTRSKIST
jgi:hypothetical protein